MLWHEADTNDANLFAVETVDEPVFGDMEPSPTDWPLLTEDVALDDGWHYSLYTWSVVPSTETIVFTLRGRIVLDILIIETCTEEAPEPRVIYVDDDAASDPGPGDIHISDPFEDGSLEHPFDSVQEGIDAAVDCDTVLIYDGRYFETIDLQAKMITLTGLWLTDATVHEPSIIDANGLCPVVTCTGGLDRGCVIEGLTITGGMGDTDVAMFFDEAEPYISNCLVVGNTALVELGTIITCIDSEPNFVNCTISGNRAGADAGVLALASSKTQMINSIEWANEGPGLLIASWPRPEILYSDVTFNWGGSTMLYVDPVFVEQGSWFDPGTPEDLSDDVWVEGDYHLQSTQGRFDVLTATWVLDATDSSCIDAGDTSMSVDDEPAPNGDRLNLGVYGGTAQASKSL